ncbi:nucleotide-binding universal stress UspA family protein [Nonlabens dokdonensis]|uniref:Nucleotide-binding universal stress UspA family protein n=2 Tax=Nonlabens dokdonensis TaxID=328515 RepID=A0ABX5PZT3_9FLAO|nr:universal stress protein [Nonlabens dokdonensis]AGC75424.1 putative universal stress protein [Nonlabens dokdonensis DSW-6]PZX43123.1 nucleotide-binding universal stress UspA family protein [Nonlabens dokdonensis]
MKTILLPTDFSETSINAVAYAVQLFKKQHCTFIILNTYQPVAVFTATTYGNNPELDMNLGQLFQEKSETKVQEIIKQMSTTYANSLHTFEGRSSFNLLSLEIEEIVVENDIDVIIMGTNGASGLTEVFIGSQTMQVIKAAKTPVIGVPAGSVFKDPNKILFTTDYNINKYQNGLPLLQDISNNYSPELIFLNVYKGQALTSQQKGNKDSLDEYFENDHHLTHILESRDVLEAIKGYESTHEIDMVVLVRNKHNFFENLMFKPVVQKIVHHSKVPFLILPPDQSA